MVILSICDGNRKIAAPMVLDPTERFVPISQRSAAQWTCAENATGNFVKVVQRLPVRIRFQPNQRDLDRLRPGMSVEPKVHFD